MNLLEIRVTLPKEWEESFVYFITDILEIEQFASEEKGNTVIFQFYITETEKNSILLKINDFLTELKQNEELNLEDYHWQIEEKILDNEDWLHNWKKYFVPIEIGKLRIRPPWEQKKEGYLDLVINPKMGFGTGQHPTTFLCLESLLEEDLSSKKVLDIGAGSGILGAAALLLGASSCVFVEKDAPAIESCKETVKMNQLSKKSKIILSDILKNPNLCFQQEYDIAFINIIAEVIIEILDIEALQQVPVIFLSGIIREKKNIVENKIKSINFLIAKEKMKEDWVFYKIIKP